MTGLEISDDKSKAKPDAVRDETRWSFCAKCGEKYPAEALSRKGVCVDCKYTNQREDA